MKKIAKLGIAVAGVAAVGYLAYKGLKHMIEDLDGWKNYCTCDDENCCCQDENCDCGCHEEAVNVPDEPVEVVIEDEVKEEMAEPVVEEKPADAE